jgi:hypothetical protein
MHFYAWEKGLKTGIYYYRTLPAVNPINLSQAIEIEPELRKARDDDEQIAKLLDIALQLEGLHRHASTHAAGVVIAGTKLEALVPVCSDPNSQMLVVQYSMKYAEAAGLVKFDFLGLKTLTMIDHALILIKASGVELNFKKIRYALEAPLVWFGIVFFRSLKIENASNLAGKIAIFIGSKIAVNKLAMNNLSKALPHLDSSQKNAVINDMWDNLGRVVGEFPHVCKMSADEILQHVEIDENSKKILDDLIAKNQGGIIFSAHFGNWEIGPKILIKYGRKCWFILYKYRIKFHDLKLHFY